MNYLLNKANADAQMWEELANEYKTEVERLRRLVEPKEWMGWDQVNSIYDEAKLLRKERDDARAEVERLREALQAARPWVARDVERHGWGDHEVLAMIDAALNA